MAQCPNCGCGLLTHERRCPRCQLDLPAQRKRGSAARWVYLALLVIVVLGLVIWLRGR